MYRSDPSTNKWDYRDTSIPPPPDISIGPRRSAQAQLIRFQCDVTRAECVVDALRSEAEAATYAVSPSPPPFADGNAAMI
jgi:hypothetical protein